MTQADDLRIVLADKSEFRETWKVIGDGIGESNRVAPGLVAGAWIASHPNQIFVFHAGVCSTEPMGPKVRVDTPFDLASLSKVFATAGLAAILVERGWIRFDDPVTKFLPGFEARDIRLSHLLSHTAGYEAWRPIFEDYRKEFSHHLESYSVAERQDYARKLVLSISPEVKVETRCLYSDFSAIVLGFVLEEVCQLPLDEAVSRFLWEPMGIFRAHYRRVEKDAKSGSDPKYAATENCSWRGAVLQGQVHDDNCWAMGGYAGHTGVFADIRDVMHFARNLYSRFFSIPVLTSLWSQYKSFNRTIGFDRPSEGSSSGKHFREDSIGHLGFTGTSLWLDPDGVAVGLLTNRVHPSRENNEIRKFRPKFHDAVRKDLLANGF